MAAIRRVLTDAGATVIRVSRDEAQRAAPVVRAQGGVPGGGPHLARLLLHRRHDSAPRAAAACCARSAEWSHEFGLPCANVFHAGDGNLHPLILFDANVPGEIEKTIAFGDRILELCIEVGGTVTGEHGVGVEKLSAMCVQFAPAELERFLGIKAAFDAHGLLNPGKGVPTLARCGEFGKNACAPRRGAASRIAAILGGDRDERTPGRPRPPRARSRGRTGRPAGRAVRRARGHQRGDSRAAWPWRRAGRCRTARRRRISRHQRRGRGHRAVVPCGTRAGHRVRCRHVARGPRRGALRRRMRSTCRG